MLNTEIRHALNEINFPIAVQEIPTIPNDQFRKIVRTDSDTFLGMCKTRYKPINHMDAFGGAIENIINAGLKVNPEDIKVESYEHGAMAKMEFTIPQQKVIVGKHELTLKYIARNSYNGRWKFQSFFGWLNAVCFNTLVSGRQLAYTANRHTKLFDIEASNAKIYNAVEAVTDETKNYTDWWYKRIDDDQVADMFKKTICKKDTNIQKYVSEDQETNKKRLSQLMDLYDAERRQIHGKGDYTNGYVKGSLWCAFQLATYWSTHIDSTMAKDNYKKHIIQQKRETSVRNMINSNTWKELEKV